MIADFLNRPLTDDVISRIAEQCNFITMKKDRDATLTVPFRDGRNVPILRKGLVGDWKIYFTPELNERFDREVLAKLHGTGLENHDCSRLRIARIKEHVVDAINLNESIVLV